MRPKKGLGSRPPGLRHIINLHRLLWHMRQCKGRRHIIITVKCTANHRDLSRPHSIIFNSNCGLTPSILITEEANESISKSVPLPDRLTSRP
ncbi:hypothetical protein DPMN_097209 [Dreissena polymorpha]|uniref:Uncharacterized protein n=1 Tax=Dreissena polymorpha TaxID=45954 RepID=A0A9D4LA51_DREPO|nr:hypothetical protein DPMN_097209 [Dreissena polymorpha]